MSRNRMLNQLAWLLGGSVPRRREDIMKLLRQASDFSQALGYPEATMIENVLQLPDVPIENVMLPHGKVDWLQADDTYAQIMAKVKETHHSRYPVMDTDEEKVKGILHVKHLLGIEAEPDDLILGSISLQAARTVPGSKKLDSMLREFQHYRTHMMVVADDAGRPLGMIFIEDLLEHIVGAMHDEFDKQAGVDAPIRSKGGDKWEADGEAPLSKFNSQFGLRLDTNRFDTLGGWIANRMGEMPAKGKKLSEHGLTITVIQADDRRVRTVEIERSRSDDGGATTT